MRSTDLPVGSGEKGDRAKRLADELRSALATVPKAKLVRCVLMTPVHTTAGVKYRLSKAASVVRRLIINTDDLMVEGYKSFRAGDARGYAERCLKSGKAVLKSSASTSRAIAHQMPRWLHKVRTGPADALPEVIGATLGLLIGSGGLDANGGLPDLDLMAGIGNHRSFLTHSILMGAASEAVLIALDEVVLLAYENLPADHDPIWDTLYCDFQRTTRAAKVGVGLGIAYHLGTDGSLQVAAYKDLPFSIPMAAHEALFEMNAGVEAIYATSKLNIDRPETSANE